MEMNEKKNGFKLTIDATDTGEGYECNITAKGICDDDLITCLRALCRAMEDQMGENTTIAALLAVIGEQFGMKSFQTAGETMLRIAKGLIKEEKEEREENKKWS